MATRPLQFELHILPMLRMVDRDNMLWAFDLWDYDQVKSHADDILARIRVDMPPRSFGGPWPDEWVSVFQRWKDEGFSRLQLGTVDGSGYTATRSGDTVTLSCRGSVPTSGYRVWLEGNVLEQLPRQYILYWEAPVPLPAASPSVFRARAKFLDTNALTNIAVVDGSGSHTVPITSSIAPFSIRGSLAKVKPSLEALGATLIGTEAVIGGSIDRYRLGSDEVELFSDGHNIDVTTSHRQSQVLKQAFGVQTK